MSVQLQYAAFSDIGLVRKSNQDAGYASGHLLVLADGMGGAAAGDIASSVTVGFLAQVDQDLHTADELLPALRTAVNTAHQDLIERVDEDPEIAGLGTTCIAILRSNNKLAMVHVGDSRAYLLREGALNQVTKDHTLVQFLVDHGQLTPEEAEHHPKRNVIMRALGDAPGPVELDESVREAVPGDRWLLCSDGLFGVVAHDTIERTLKTYHSLTECGEHLIELALAAGAPDNVTVVLADVVDDSDSSVGKLNTGGQQPIVVGSAARDAGSRTRRGTSAAGRAFSLFIPSRATDPDLLPDDDEPVHPRLFARIAVIVAVIAMVAGGLFAGYRWTQSQYYVSTNEGYVAIYRGIPQSIGGIELSSLEETSAVRVADLLPVAQSRLETPILRDSLEDAQQLVANFGDQMATPSQDPTADATADADASASASASASPTQDASSPSPTTGGEETP